MEDTFRPATVFLNNSCSVRSVLIAISCTERIYGKVAWIKLYARVRAR